MQTPQCHGYLVAGLLIGPSVLGIIPENIVSSFSLISDVALGFIAFSIGNEFKFSYFKRVGVTPIVIAVFESLFAVLFVFFALLIAGNSVPFSLVLGSIAAATAPAATIMVINQYKARGVVTETLLSVVAIDDATALIFFSISVAIAQTILNPAAVSLSSSILSRSGKLLALDRRRNSRLHFQYPLRWFKKHGNRLALVIAFIFAGVGIANSYGFSSLLLCMALGATFANLSPELDPVMEIVNDFTPRLSCCFSSAPVLN
jgi:Kef-type K+ transport system membrane component KefB